MAALCPLNFFFSRLSALKRCASEGCKEDLPQGLEHRGGSWDGAVAQLGIPVCSAISWKGKAAAHIASRALLRREQQCSRWLGAASMATNIFFSPLRVPHQTSLSLAGRKMLLTPVSEAPCGRTSLHGSFPVWMLNTNL